MPASCGSRVILGCLRVQEDMLLQAMRLLHHRMIQRTVLCLPVSCDDGVIYGFCSQEDMLLWA